MNLSLPDGIKRILFLLSIIFCTEVPDVFAQSCDCNGTKPGTFFRLQNNKTFILCGGNKETLTLKGKAIYSDFSLFVCGNDEAMDFRDGTNSYLVRNSNDTLYIEEIGNLPVGKDFQYEKTIWKVERFFFQNNKLIRTISPNPGIGKYSIEETKAVIRQYETYDRLNDEDIMDLINRLFVAAISGSDKANRYFFQFQDKFGPLDGVRAEEYNLLCKIMRLYQAH